MYKNIRLKNNVAETLQTVKELSGAKSLSDTIIKTINSWFEKSQFELLENVAIDNDISQLLSDANLSVSKLASDNSIYVICYNDEIIELENGDIYLSTKNFTPEKTNFSDESLVTDKITKKDWNLIASE